ncbi:hypothetical protein Tco_0021999, partial [Tanacetum coccineum]
MYYPRFTKVIVDYFMTKDQGVPRRNKMFWHYKRDDFMFTTVRVISKHQDTQVYGVILPQHLTNQAMLESNAYMTYRAYATGEKTPKPKTTKKKADSESSLKTKSTQAYKGNAVDIQSKVPDEQQQNISGTNEGDGHKLEVPDVPEYRSKSEEESWTYNQGEDDEDNDKHDSENDNDDEDDDQKNVSGETESDNDKDDFVHPNLSTYKVDDQEEKKKKKRQMMMRTYLNLNLERRDAEMTDAQVTQEKEEVHVTFTTELLVVQQQSSSISSDLVSKFINLTPDTGIDSTLNLNIQSDIPVNVLVSVTTTTPSS